MMARLMPWNVVRLSVCLPGLTLRYIYTDYLHQVLTGFQKFVIGHISDNFGKLEIQKP